MESNEIKKMSKAGLLAALTFAATMLIHFPLPGVGYVHPGDAVVLLCGAFAGPFHGFLAAGIGSALADLALGYTVYAPVTFVVKGLAALLPALLYRRSAGTAKFFLGCLAGAAVIVLGYFVYENALYGFPMALAGVLPNAAQSLFGVLAATVLCAQGLVKRIER